MKRPVVLSAVEGSPRSDFLCLRIGEFDRRLRGAAEIYVRAHAWGHLPPSIDFKTFLAAMARGDDPFVKRLDGEGSEQN